MPDTRLTVVVGISGGIAAYKAVGVVRAFVRDGHDVHVIPTEHALRFVGVPTLEAISRNPVATSVFDNVAEVRHVALGQRADLIVIAPATANTIARMATGAADDLLGTTLLASSAPVVIAPAMHPQMWEHPATTANIATLRGRGVHIIGPEVGALTGDDSGTGRMSEPDQIAEAALQIAGQQSKKSGQIRDDLIGVHITISAGGTREPFDPVRFIGNRSSGRQGVAISTEAARRGATVTLIAANVDQQILNRMPGTVTVKPVGSAAELAAAVLEEAHDADVVIMTAAVADYRPAAVASEKIKKDATGDTMTVEMVKNPDILAELVRTKRDAQLVIGFAAETEPDREARLQLGRAKIARKPADLLVVNHVGWSEGFEQENNTVDILLPDGTVAKSASGSKADVAHVILDLVATANA